MSNVFERNKMKVLVTGGTGMVGNALKKILPDATYLSSMDCDLRDTRGVSGLFFAHKPDAVIHLAARVVVLKTILILYTITLFKISELIQMLSTPV
jgi:UDP-glucose 4-epimerase